MRCIVILLVIFLFSCGGKNQTKTTVENIGLNETEITDIGKFDIFHNDLFNNISLDPELYKNNSSFVFNEIFLDSVMPQKNIIVGNDDIEIIYYFRDFNTNGRWHITQSVTLKNKTDKYYLGNFFEKNSEEILQLITNTPDYVGKDQIDYSTIDYPKYFVIFYFKNNKVNKIRYGAVTF